MSYQTKNYGEQGGERTVIGGSLDVVSGGELDIESGGALKLSGVAVSASAAQINAAGANTGTIKAGSYTVVTADDDAGTKSIATGLASIAAFAVTILRAGVPLFSDQALSVSGGNIVVADGAATYELTAGDVITWFAAGAMA